MKKAADAFRSIGEVSQLVGVAPHVLRYWETQFPLFSPVKRRDGRRYYRPDDIRLAAGLCEMLREDGVSIRGARKQMAADRGAGLRMRGAQRLGGAYGPAPAAATPADGTPGAAAASPAEATPADGTPSAAAAAAVAGAGDRPRLPTRQPEPATAIAGRAAAPSVTAAPAPDTADIGREAGMPETATTPHPAKPARRRKAAAAETLPLFPELDLPDAPPEPARRGAPESRQPGTRPDWLNRLETIREGLLLARALPAAEAGALLDRLAACRRALAA